MGRTNAIILAMGLGAALALSLMMQHVLRVHGGAKQHPVVREIQSAFGSRLARPAEFRARDLENGKVAELVVYPVLGVSRLRLAQDVGGFVWRRVGLQLGLDALVVVCVDLDGERTSFPIQRPYVSPRARPEEKRRGEPAGAAERASRRRGPRRPARPGR